MIYELYGRQAEHLAVLQKYFAETQKLLASLRLEEVLPSQLIVTENGWNVGPTSGPEDTAPNVG